MGWAGPGMARFSTRATSCAGPARAAKASPACSRAARTSAGVDSSMGFPPWAAICSKTALAWGWSGMRTSYLPWPLRVQLRDALAVVGGHAAMLAYILAQGKLAAVAAE